MSEINLQDPDLWNTIYDKSERIQRDMVEEEVSFDEFFVKTEPLTGLDSSLVKQAQQKSKLYEFLFYSGFAVFASAAVWIWLGL